jgi:hypothetical protein
MAHLTRGELERWYRNGQAADRAHIVGHLAECDACGTLYTEIVDSRPVAAPESGNAPAGLLAHARDMYRAPSRRNRARLHWWTVGAAAAALIGAIALAAVRQSGLRIDTADHSAIRGTSLQPMTPIGSVSAPVTFQWASPVSATRFDVEVHDDEQRLLFTLASQGNSVELTGDQASQLVAGRTYHWQVIAYGPAGEEIMRAPRRSFVISR